MSHPDDSHLTQLLDGFTGAELEFLAEESQVWVLPSFSAAALPLLGSSHGPVGPFAPPLPARVPLWLAISLRKQRKATLLLPDWMSLERLSSWADAERASDAFVRPPVECYIEVARLLLHYAREDLGSAMDTKAIEERLGDIQDIRQAKIKKGLNMIHDSTSFIKLNNMSSMELNSIRSFYSAALRQFARLHAAAEDGSASAANTQQSEDAGVRAARAADEATRRNIRRSAAEFGAGMPPPLTQAPSFGAPAAAAAAGPPSFTQASASSSQPGLQPSQSQQQPPVEEQARKLRRFGP